MNENEEILSQREKEIISDRASKVVKANRIIWIAWWSGMALIVGSWVNVVSNTIGWIGFALAMAASVVSVVLSRYWKFPK